MKTLLLTLALLTSMSSFAGYDLMSTYNDAINLENCIKKTKRLSSCRVELVKSMKTLRLDAVEESIKIGLEIHNHQRQNIDPALVDALIQKYER